MESPHDPVCVNMHRFLHLILSRRTKYHVDLYTVALCAVRSCNKTSKGVIVCVQAEGYSRTAVEDGIVVKKGNLIGP